MWNVYSFKEVRIDRIVRIPMISDCKIFVAKGLIPKLPKLTLTGEKLVQLCISGEEIDN